MENTVLDNVALLALGFGILVNGANLFVKSAGSIARRYGFSELTIGLTLVAVGTSLPELVAAIIASRGNDGALVLGNVIGANIANLTLVIGGAAVLGTVILQRETLERDGYLAICAAVLLLFFGFDGYISAREGLVLTVLFFAYTAFLIETSQVYEQAYHIRHFSRYFFGLGFVTGPMRGLVRAVNRRVMEPADPGAVPIPVLGSSSGLQ